MGVKVGGGAPSWRASAAIVAMVIEFLLDGSNLSGHTVMTGLHAEHAAGRHL
jgi:hypothetical protein